ncbi:hypothetical protein K439DRAFT_1622102 [Ramaria rubella]|nr:hypothetical protein K439DRAFT_1622102 [Ramaria rubella]
MGLKRRDVYTSYMDKDIAATQSHQTDLQVAEHRNTLHRTRDGLGTITLAFHPLPHRPHTICDPPFQTFKFMLRQKSAAHFSLQALPMPHSGVTITNIQEKVDNLMNKLRRTDGLHLRDPTKNNARLKISLGSSNESPPADSEVFHALPF